MFNFGLNDYEYFAVNHSYYQNRSYRYIVEFADGALGVVLLDGTFEDIDPIYSNPPRACQFQVDTRVKLARTKDGIALARAFFPGVPFNEIGTARVTHVSADGARVEVAFDRDPVTTTRTYQASYLKVVK